MSNIPNRPRGRNGGRPPLPLSEKLQSITIQLRPFTITKLRAYCRDNKAWTQGELVGELLEKFFRERNLYVNKGE